MQFLTSNDKLGMRNRFITIPNYTFPIINHIDDIRPAIAGHEEFREFDRDDHIVIKYVVNKEDSFPHLDIGGYHGWNNATILRRECRGIAFDKATGLIIRRPPHKFFNLNERPESSFDKIDWSESPFIVMEKLDGSCISAYKDKTGRIVWGTPAGETDFSPYVEIFVAENPQYAAAASYLIDLGWTPTFEFCAYVNRVVIEHPETRLVLTCVRNVITGEYLPHDQMIALREFGIEVVDQIDIKGNFETKIKTLVELAQTVGGIEGWVIRFDSGHMIKVKTKWYCDLHGLCTEVRFEKDVLNLILNKRLDDAIPFVTPDRAQKWIDYASEVYQGFDTVASRITLKVRELEHLDKKSFAAACQGSPYFSFLMDAYDQKIARNTSGPYDPVFLYVFDRLWEYVRDRTMTQTWVDRLRHLYDNKKFTF